jgi:cellulose biosynthesis protein BcsQ
MDVLPSHPSLDAVALQLSTSGGLVTSVRRILRPLMADYDHVVLDTRGDLSGLTLAALCAADAVLLGAACSAWDVCAAPPARCWRPSRQPACR